MKIDRILIQKFLANQCTEEEAAEVLDYFSIHPDEIERYIPPGDWLNQLDMYFDTDASSRMMERIRIACGLKTNARGIKSVARYAIAASLIGIVIWLGGNAFHMENHANAIGLVSKAGTDVESPVSASLINMSDAARQAILPDGSNVVIYPQSTVEYREIFGSVKRNVLLKGKALFDVKKDASRPFTVFARGIATTALGTRFLVAAQRDQHVSVVLFEGKVKVWQEKGIGTEIILRPGDELLVNSRLFSDHSISRKGREQIGNSQWKTQPEHAEKEEVIFQFKNLSLKQVFRQIELKFKVNINTGDKMDFEGKLFTGTFFKGDNLDFIFKAICNQQGLHFNIDGNNVSVASQ
jgi:hypothetical protein